MTTGLIRTFRHYIQPFTGWFYKSSGNEEADRVNLYDVLFGSPQTPLSINIGYVYASDIDVAGSSVGTFTGEITDLVDSLDSTLSSETDDNPKYFEIKLVRPVENTSIKFCSPVGKNFSNVKIILKDRSGAELYTMDDSSNNTDYQSKDYYWPQVAWCTIRVEFHTTDQVHINWSIIEKLLPVTLSVKHIDDLNSTTSNLTASGQWTGKWVDTRHYVQSIIDITTDQEGELIIDLSRDGSTVVHSHRYNILPNNPDGHHYPSELELTYYRLRYINGSSDQTVFKLYSTLFNTMVEEGHSHGLDYGLQDDHPAPIIRAIQTGKKPNGDYVNAEYTAGGNPKASIEELDDTVQQLLSLYPAGTGSNGAVTLTSADTAYAVPTVAPTNSYRINLYNGADTSIFLGYENSNTNGIELPPGDTAEDDLSAGQQLYAYCASAGKILTYTYKEVI